MRPLPMLLVSALMVFFACMVCTMPAHGQDDEGDRFLDGIGETALNARYLFNGNAKDSTRHNSHATLQGTGATFVEDSQFGSVLSLPGKGGACLKIPGRAALGIDAISVTAWVNVKSNAPARPLFDFGKDANANFFCVPIGSDAAKGYRAKITSKGPDKAQGPTAPSIKPNAWVHLAVVLNAAKQTLSTYADGVRVGQATNVTVNLEQILNQDDAAANQLFIGKSQGEGDATLGAKIHDFRVYSIALSDRQVATIRHNAISDEDAVTSKEQPKEETPAVAKKISSMPTVLGLVSVPDIAVETVVGHLPQLPHNIPGVYPDGVKGPKVRVIWPAPKDNSQVLKPGTYTLTGVLPGTGLETKATVTVKATSDTRTAPQRKLLSFPLGQVVLNLNEKHKETKFIQNRDKFILTLAKTNPDSFLYMFRDAFGEKQPEGAKPLGVWDSQTCKLRGHASGHYLSAIAQAYAGTTYDEELRANFRKKMDYLIGTLYDLSQKSGKPEEEGGKCVADPTAVPTGPGKDGYNSNLTTEGIRNDYWNWGKGFISAYPPDQFIMLEKGATYGGKENQIWAPYYTLHKILAGLMDCYEVAGNEKALEIARGMGLWVHARLKLVPTETRIQMWNRYIAGEYGGMNEAMARLARLTGDKRFLECATLFDNIDFFFGNAKHDHGLACNVDTLRGKHANQHIPQITGALETYAGTKDAQYYRVAENFWNICTHCYMYNIGGVAGASNPKNSECFTAEPNTLFKNGFARGGQNETCATYNLLKLSRQLFMFNPDGKYMDYYEQALYNHILASVAENSAANTYHVPLNPGAGKHFGNPNMTGFTCCNGTALESSTKLQDSIYFKSLKDDALYVNLYVPSTLTWAEKKVVVKQTTNFPYADTTKLTITGDGTFDIKVRVPRWATQGFFVRIGGKEQKVNATPGSYLSLGKTWKSGDTIELRMPFSFRLGPVMDQPNIASIFYGPVLLAAEEPEARTEWRPVTLNAKDLGKSITGDPSTLRFKIGDVNLMPFYELYGRHSVYLNVTLE